MRCPNCRSESDGAFCPDCGTPLRGGSCAACRAELPAGARYCVQCGRAVRPAAPKLPWLIAGASLAALVAVLLVPALRPAGGAPSGAPPGAVAGPDSFGTPPPLTGTPREQADRLFNRVMETMAAGDTAGASFFMPMAIAAYRQAGELDADGLYHLSVLEAAAGDAAAARATAERVLRTLPDHLLALGAAARAARDAGDEAAARAYYEQLLAAYDRERGEQLPEYLDHARILPGYRAEAEAYLGR